MKYVAYYRVSTEEQGRSGLGLEAQQKTVSDFVRVRNGELIADFQEVESGKNDDRAELDKALKLCRQRKATLLIAKLDRLARDLAFIAILRAGRVPFICCDMPEADTFTIHIHGAVAQREHELISDRTKAGLAATKARGTVLGRRDADTQRMADRRRAQAAAFRKTVYPTIRQMRDNGQTLTQIAENLNEMKVSTCNKRTWYASTVRQLLNTEDKNAA